MQVKTIYSEVEIIGENKQTQGQEGTGAGSKLTKTITKNQINMWEKKRGNKRVREGEKRKK